MRRNSFMNKAASYVLSAILCLQFAGCRSAVRQPQNTETAGRAEETSVQSGEENSAENSEVFEIERPNTQDYKLKEVVVFSRHNIRAPLSSNGSVNEIATPHEWVKWTANSSELSLKGGILETEMGQYFRKWLESEELIPENYIPEDGETRFYANSKQRTIATAQYFSSGMLPAANVDIERRGEFGKMDDTFNPKLHFSSAEYEADVLAQINEICGENGIEGAVSQLNYDLLTDVIDYKDSEGYKSGELGDLKTDDTEIILEDGKEPAMKGSLKTACQISDALVLQYYEEPDEKKAAFGKDLTLDQWAEIANIKEVYGKVLQSAPMLALNMADPLLEEIKGELENDSRKFTFLCGHDVNITNILSSLEVEQYELPYTLETNVPIGSKLVFEKWENSEGKQFVCVEFVYQSTEQLRNNTPLTLDTPPVIYPISFKDMEKNEDGLYTFEDIDGRFEKAINAYYDMEKQYTGSLAEAA